MVTHGGIFHFPRFSYLPLEKRIDLFAGEELEQACKPRNANLVQFHVSVRCLVQISLENGGCLYGTLAEREE